MENNPTVDNNPRRQRPAGGSSAAETGDFTPQAGASPRHGSTLQAGSKPAPEQAHLNTDILAGDATTPSIAPPTPQKVTRIGRFEVVKLLGTGAFGRVYHARDPELRRDVAIKMPRLETLTPEFRERFLREARAAATIRHPNVCPVYDVVAGEDVPYIVMGFIPGKTLAEVIANRNGPFPAKQAAGVVRRLALALEAAHQQGIIHRDLKPSNILVDSDRKDVIVTDFGLAKLVGDMDAAATKHGDVLGTPAYMSPEQARGEIDKIGPQADIYSLGVILYEMLTGEVPFKGTVTEVIGQLLTTPPRPLSKLCPQVDPQLDAICQLAMSKDLTERFATARELAHVLGEYLRTGNIPSMNEATAVPEMGFELQPSDVIRGVPIEASQREEVEEPIEATASFPRRSVNRSRKSAKRKAERRKAEQRKKLMIWSTVGVIGFALGTYGLIAAMRPSKPVPAIATEKKPDAKPLDSRASEPSPAPRKGTAPPMELPPSSLPTLPIPKLPTPESVAKEPRPEPPPPKPKDGNPPLVGPNGLPVLFDVDGKPIPLGPDGRPIPLDPNGRVPPLGPDGRPPPGPGFGPPGGGRPGGGPGGGPQSPGGRPGGPEGGPGGGPRPEAPPPRGE